MIFDKKVNYYQVSQGVWGLKTLFVNIYMIANRKGVADGWVLVDAGLRGYSSKIISMAESLFGEGTKPLAIILTHGHFDHVSGLEDLLKHWDVPVYAHPLELPYLTGKSSYPPADPTVGGGLMSWASWMFPSKPINLGDRVQALDTSGTIEELREWKTIHTPGHSPGHISLFFKLNATLIAGDAFATTKMESALYALTFVQRLSGPPKFLTTDWAQAAESVRKLCALEPRTVAAGHGYAMRGKELQAELKNLADNFEDIAIPANGRYVKVPAEADMNGTEYVPPVVLPSKTSIAAIALVSVAIGYFAVREVQKKVGVILYLRKAINTVLDPNILKKLIVTPMPYGKYKGTMICNLPVHYLEWMYTQGFPPGNLGMMLHTIHEIKINGLEYLLAPLKRSQ